VDLGLEGKVALVGGASRGLGYAICELLGIAVGPFVALNALDHHFTWLRVSACRVSTC
jgi:NAD(P)-dependent dehydrogenase (short-subunit alcohol dehydrogenase family)